MKRIFCCLILFAGITSVSTAHVRGNNTKERKVKALYLSTPTVSNVDSLQHFIYLARHSVINSYVIDIKGIDGLVTYESKIPDVRNLKAWTADLDIKKVINVFHQNHIYVIGRIACFNDPYLPTQKNEWAVKDNHGNLYASANGETWLSPANIEVWKYLVDIAKEALAKGVDEIQFDYVRFPFAGDTLDFGEKVKVRHEAIDAFLAYARKEMPKAVLSADVFGIICESVNDPENIGQNIEFAGRNLNYISPMTYPSLYAKGQHINNITFPIPDLDPYGVVYNSLVRAKDRIAKVKGYSAKLRPYLQSYTASWLSKGDFQTYGVDQLRLQIKAAIEAGCDQWIFWNEENRYPEAAFEMK